MRTKYLVFAILAWFTTAAGAATPVAAPQKVPVRAAAQKSAGQKATASRPVASQKTWPKTVMVKATAPKASFSRPAAPAPESLLPAVSASSPVVAAELPLGQEELSIAERVHHGNLPCELGAMVRVEPDEAQPGYFHVLGKGFRYRMHPVATSTGAIRLEDKDAGAVWLQLANKSMLMDQKKGQRLADECANPDQMAFAAQMKTSPPPALFDTSGMGR